MTIEQITTRRAAELLQTTSHAMRIRLFRSGSYYGILPEKLPNGRLMWPGNIRERLIEARKEAARAYETALMQGN
ncbi:hypothetical protein F6R98_20000 [Candidatus Methylospira mobilis]|uniref:DNA-binding protein n=1 Tax=Candidatus Methylospira mobilis TaxID=1808979 RepID=A0A5Q0BRC5_9GAMM|nr:hypothetical protein [Candidatus Methylospira mobilis]QFY44627.1 hypothetical protein F6R98_20000 [Candidatus Methylospira mobilis]